ncbi:hypothetical protein [Roseateles sp.]|uniref:hypothetical protein n=1 Tax=Roseateles sp. TaxID=1971397 RepID=UPI0025DFD248|nr:hypothetical protein [Roseateles sp.]MBV8035285.1 hypothetical protein [Roseateles sp.]
MPKTVAAAALPGTSGTAVATVRKRTKATGTSISKPVRTVAAKQIDPKVRTAIKKAGSDPLVVMVKFDTRGSGFGQLPVTNRAGGARERAFNKEVEAEVGKSAANGKYRIVSVASNIGVATVEASASIVRDLIASSKIAGMKLKV